MPFGFLIIKSTKISKASMNHLIWLVSYTLFSHLNFFLEKTNMSSTTFSLIPIYCSPHQWLLFCYIISWESRILIGRVEHDSGAHSANAYVSNHKYGPPCNFQGEEKRVILHTLPNPSFLSIHVLKFNSTYNILAVYVAFIYPSHPHFLVGLHHCWNN